MEFNFNEPDYLGNDDNFDVNKYNSMNDQNIEKYWETPKVDNSKKKKVSFDDILSNMNLVVNKNGVLQYMTPIQSQEMYQDKIEHPYSEVKYKVQHQRNNSQVEPAVKHSYIYNKYFKDYNDPNKTSIPEPIVPKTIEEYRQIVLENRIKRIQEKNRVAQIKSTKMFFENVNNIKASKNKLRMMNFN